MKKTSFWVILIVVIALLSAAAALWLRFHDTGAAYANVYLDGECVRSIDLRRVRDTETFLVQGPIGTNTVEAENGRIRVVCADCPDQVCVHMGWLSSEGLMPIVCLPNRLVIQVEDAPAAVSGGGTP